MLNQPLHQESIETKPQTVAAFQRISTKNPFPGLRPFNLDESYLYFGREGQINDILGKFVSNRFVTVMGYSGSGKSSLMYCGFVPVLLGGFMANATYHWNVLLSRPGRSPISSLASSAVDFMISRGTAQEEDRDLHKTIISSILRNSAGGLVELARYIQSQKNENVFFLIDQFEELFRFKGESATGWDWESDAQQYVRLILEAISQREVPVYVALTMRSDFIGECAAFPGLAHEINKSNYLVPQMTREQKRAAIEGPVAVAGGQIAPRLVKRLLNDVGNNQDQLPILQHALMRTWDHWVENHEAGEPMDLRHYNSVGRITQALSLHANELYDELTTREKEIAEVLFKNITEKSANNRGLRRPCRLGLVAELSEASEEEVVKVIDHFRQPGRSFLMPAAHIPLSSDSMIELSHESLMRIWNRLSQWVEEEFESASMYKRLSEAAAMYQIGKTGLWRPPDLQLALNWQKKQRPTREWAQRYDETFERAIVFLETSRITYEAELKNQEMMQKRVLRRTRATAVILGVVSIVAILFFVLSYIQKLQADQERFAAEESRREAEIQKLIATREKIQADSLRGVSEERNEALRETMTRYKQALDELALQKKAAEDALAEAKRQEQIAKDAGFEQLLAKDEALFYAEQAASEYKIAQRLYMLTKAQELASKAAVEDDDEQLAGLQAMQAFNFHTRFQGKKYDRYIYDGLYNALTNLSGKSYNAIKMQGPPRIHMRSLSLARGNMFFVAGADGRIYTGNFRDLTNKVTSYQTPYPSKVIALSPHEDYLVNGSDSTLINVYNLKAPSKDRVVRLPKTATNDLEFLPDNSAFLVAAQDKSLIEVNPATGEQRTLLMLPYEVKDISISTDGKRLAAACWSGQVLLIDLELKTFSELFNDAAYRVLSIKFSPSGRYVAYGIEEGGKRGIVRMHDFEKNSVRQFAGHRAGVYDLEFSPDEKLLASAGSDKRLQLYVLESLEDLPVVMANNTGFIWDIEFTPESDFLVAACSESELRVWPTDPALLAKEICPKLHRSLSEDEWLKYVGEDIKYEETCLVKNK